MKRRYGVKIVSPKSIHRERADIYAPCALGNEFTPENENEIQAKIICGAANNQLTDPAIAERFRKKGILYLPDYVVNAGGLINAVSHLVHKKGRKAWVQRKVLGIAKTITRLIAKSKKSRHSLSTVSDHMAEAILRKKAYKR